MKQLSRQRKWQIRQKALGKCTVCGRPRAVGNKTFCGAHQVNTMIRQRTVARKLKGTDPNAPVRRTKPRSSDADWKTPEFYELLGTMPDLKVAQRFGVRSHVVAYHRNKLGIALFKKSKPCQSSSK